MMAPRRLCLLLCLCLGLASAAWSQEVATRVVLPRPAPGETVTIDVAPGATYAFGFSPKEALILVRDTDVVLRFDDGGELSFQDLVNFVQESEVFFHIYDTTHSGRHLVDQALALQSQSDVGAEAAGPPNIDFDPRLSQLRYSGRDILFPGETEREGHPLYSYLLYAGTSAGGREERTRFHAAIQAFVGEVRSAEALEASGAARAEINIFYAPIRAIFVDTTPQNMRTHFSQRSLEEQMDLLLNLYDYARAEVLATRMGLAGDGPYIVSVLRPLSQQAVSEDDAFLVQDLSNVPPQLVALWVKEFKRQVVQEATESPQRLRRLALHMRTQIAVLAEGFSITKSAVAEMFDEPGESTGN